MVNYGFHKLVWHTVIIAPILKSMLVID